MNIGFRACSTGMNFGNYQNKTNRTNLNQLSFGKLEQTLPEFFESMKKDKRKSPDLLERCERRIYDGRISKNQENKELFEKMKDKIHEFYVKAIEEALYKK